LTLHELKKHYSKRQFGKRVSKHKLILVELSHLVHKSDRLGSIDCCVGSGRRRSAQAVESVDAVDDLVQHPDEMPQPISVL